MTTLVLALLGSWFLTATVLGLFLARMISEHYTHGAEMAAGSSRSTRAA